MDSGMPNPFTTLGADPDDQPEKPEKTPFPISSEERTLLVKSEAFLYKIPPQVCVDCRGNTLFLDKSVRSRSNYVYTV
jgi:hypothetical protein